MTAAKPSPSRRSAAVPVVKLPHRSDFERLTRCQQAAVRMAAYGYTPAQTAAFLRRSVGTIETHLWQARQALGVPNATVLVRYAVTIGEVWPGPEA